MLALRRSARKRSPSPASDATATATAPPVAASASALPASPAPAAATTTPATRGARILVVALLCVLVGVAAKTVIVDALAGRVLAKYARDDGTTHPWIVFVTKSGVPLATAAMSVAPMYRLLSPVLTRMIDSSLTAARMATTTGQLVGVLLLACGGMLASYLLMLAAPRGQGLPPLMLPAVRDWVRKLARARGAVTEDEQREQVDVAWCVISALVGLVLLLLINVLVLRNLILASVRVAAVAARFYKVGGYLGAFVIGAALLMNGALPGLGGGGGGK